MTTHSTDWQLISLPCLLDRVIPQSGAPAMPSGDVDVLTLVIIVGGALLITLLARRLSSRGGRK